MPVLKLGKRTQLKQRSGPELLRGDSGERGTRSFDDSFPSVDLQDIVGMSRKNDSAILNKCLHMAASGLTKNRMLFTMEGFARRSEVSLR